MIKEYQKSDKGISKMFKAMFLASEEFCDQDCVNFSWKDELEDV